MRTKEDVYKEQALWFSNVPIVDRRIRASIHLEAEEDECFWNAMLQQYREGKYNYIYSSKSVNDVEATGCEQCLNFLNYLSKSFFICIDSDFRYLLNEKEMKIDNYILQTYTYSWENHYCFAAGLQNKWKSTCPTQSASFNFDIFLTSYSEIIYLPLLFTLYMERNKNNAYNRKHLTQALSVQYKKGDELENGKALLERIKMRLTQSIGTRLDKSEFNPESEKGYYMFFFTQKDCYLKVRGHCLYNMIVSLGNQLCNGTSIHFVKDILHHSLSFKEYDDILRIEQDINQL